MDVRNAEKGEMDQLAQTWYDGWQDAHAEILPAELRRLRTLESFRDRLRDALPHVRVTGPIGAPDGFCIVEDDELYQLYVSEKARGSGIAAALVADAEARLSKAGVKTAWLACAIGNARAARFYEKCGWHRVGVMTSRLPTQEGIFPLEVWRYEKDLLSKGSIVQGPETGALLNLAGKVAIVTGASQGIGASIARRFAEAGASVVVHYRRKADDAAEVAASITATGGQAACIQADLSNAAAAAGLIDQSVVRFGRLDILVNNAGMFPTESLLEMTADEWRAMYASVVDTAMLATQAAARHMKSSGGGAIVNIASIGAIQPAPEHSHYNSAKAAVVMFTKSAALEFGRYGIRVNAVSPGLIARPGIEEEWPDGVARWQAKALLGRLGQPEDVADACLFLASPAARWITGQNLVVDGGVTSSAIY